MRSMMPFAAGTLAVLSALAPSQIAVPSTFADEIFASGLTSPIAIAFLPDGRLLCAEQQSGAIKVILTSGGVATMGTVPNLNTNGFHRGLLGIAVDPQWPTRPYVYAWYSTTSPAQRMRLQRFTMTGDLANAASTNLTMTSPYVILSSAPDVNDFHNGGTIAFGPDGMLYVFTGEDDSPCNARDLSSLGGKVLRLDVSSLPATGTGPPTVPAITPATHPFSTPTPNAPLVWALGIRNPFRGDIDPVSGALFIADVGENLWEEINLCAAPGMNFGWPRHEGIPFHQTTCLNVSVPVTPPLVAHHHAEGAVAIVSLAVYRNPPAPAPFAFGPAYEGSYFYADWGDGKIRRLQQNGGSWVPGAPVAGQPQADAWAFTEPARITDGAVGPDGALYYTQVVGGQIRRIRGGAPAGPTLAGSVAPASTLPIIAGNTVSLSVSAAAQPGPGASVTLTAIGLPPAAVVTPALPASGATVQAAFSWTTGFADAGRHDVLFLATDQTGMTRAYPVAVVVCDAMLAVSPASSPGIPMSGNQDIILVDTSTATFVLVTPDAMPAFPIPNDPVLDGTNFYVQVARFNPVLDAADPLKLSNALHLPVPDNAIPYGPSSGLTLSQHPYFKVRLGQVATFVVTEP
jgi:glucose/arabinose dehydrogenase